MSNCESCLMLKEAFLNIPDKLKKALVNPTYCRKCYQGECAENKRLREALVYAHTQLININATRKALKKTEVNLEIVEQALKGDSCENN